MSKQELLSRIGADGRRALNALRMEGGEPLVGPTLEFLTALIRCVTELEANEASALKAPAKALFGKEGGVKDKASTAPAAGSTKRGGIPKGKYCPGCGGISTGQHLDHALLTSAASAPKEPPK